MVDAVRTAVEALKPTIALVGAQAAKRSPGLDAGDGAQIAADVIKEVAPVIVNKANAEPFYQSRVTIGAIMTLIGGGYALLLDFTDGSLPTPDALTAQLGVIAGAALTLYGRWVAAKPLGS